MTPVLLPWKPQFVVTGVSIMEINPNSQKFCTLVDHWDSVEDNDYFSLEGFIDVMKQLRIYKTPDLQLPKYHVLKRCAAYEVRKYDPFMMAETKGDKLFGSSGDLDEVVGYIFEKNSSLEKITMSIPISVQIVLPINKELDKLLADPTTGTVKLIKVEGGIVATMKFSRKITEELVRNKEKELRFALLKAGLKPQSPSGCMLACYNDPIRSWSFLTVRFLLHHQDTYMIVI
ncbi:uncharacterized protein A4U43_C04F15280 [Asparagus officinalis]|uniref:Uncharacterized protein n=1 Tax=Asparagus officinalis TaxID=4686 RepID=A0A5P1F5V8_ASPOF|nr:uncharacterized protein A4U43_C04F15280 [Asparagus officinalis]